MYHHKSHFFRLLETVQALRSENGCPWDKRQTVASLTKHLQSEVAEVVAAITSEDPENLCEELGDLLYIIIMMAEINATEKRFTLDEVLQGITEKLIRRHPHVFAGSQVTDEEELREQWQRIKAMEKAKKLL